ncbi:DUF2073 domain-containing protein [Candidatus Woesearchaeota archaeon]|jgi:hypothetical protein|nr:DUF2073 domain-containing protein [Candidatus Woesearchaeota archaeon]
MEKRGNKKIGNIKGFSIQFMPYSEIKNLDSTSRIKKILGIVLGNEILILQGRLLPQEETRLIEDTMAMIDYTDGFKGIELAVISGDNQENFFSKITKNIANALIGSDLTSITIIGPATIVKEIKKDPKKIELFLNK